MQIFSLAVLFATQAAAQQEMAPQPAPQPAPQQPYPQQPYPQQPYPQQPMYYPQPYPQQPMYYPQPYPYPQPSPYPQPNPYGMPVPPPGPYDPTAPIQAGDPTSGICWIKSYSRGAGLPLSACPADKENYQSLCYPFCDEGYTGKLDRCLQDCPTDWRDDAYYCKKPKDYGRGPGKSKECDGCEKNAGLWYPKCDEGFHNSGCCICTPDCPEGMNDVGVSCHKGWYSRGVGTVLVCEPELEYDAGLCYTPCEHDARGIGPVCWGNCPAGLTLCGALCITPDTTCTAAIFGPFFNIFKVSSKAASGDVPGAMKSTKDTANDLTYPECATWGVPVEE